MEKLDALLEDFKKKNNYSKVIKYYGNTNSKIVILAESPTEKHLKETLSESIFCFDLKDFDQTRKSGEVVLKIFKDLGLNYNDYFFDNIFKLPIINLTDEEKNNHLELMKKELELLKPTLILTLGYVTRSYLYDLMVKYRLNYNVINIYHPSFILRSNYNNYDNYLKMWEVALNVKRNNN